MLLDTYGKLSIDESTCRERFKCFKNGDFNAEDRHGGGREKCLKMTS